jgi:predicted phage terminase large subunit-like protein
MMQQQPEHNLEEIAAEILERRAAAKNLHSFIGQAWPWVEGTKPFVDGWHIKAIAEHLEALKNGDIRRLLINIPPRCCKSTILSVMLPAWWWISSPEEQFLYVSYSMGLSMRDSVKCRRIIESPWYQARWGSIYQLAGDQSTKIRFDNTKLGYRIATSVDGTLTGEGGSVLICDDPNNVRDNTDNALESTIEWFTQVFSSRMNDPKTGKMLVIQQRCSEKDISGHILSNDKDGWTHLCLPLKYESERKCYTIPLLSTNGKPWEDPRKKEGESLWMNRMGPKEIAQLEKDLQSEYAIAGQLQQRPAPAEGGIIKKAWFKLWPAHRPFPEFEFVIQSYDTAFTEKTQNDPTACSVWGVFKSEGRWCVLLLDCWEEWLEYPQLKRKVIEEYNSMYGDPPRGVDMILIEDKGSGIALRRDLQQSGLPARAYNPGKADKIQRMNMVSYLVENGLVYLPESDKEERRGKPRSWVDPFVEQLTMFPNSKRDDWADTFSGCLWILKDMSLIADKPTYEEEEEMETWDKEDERRNPYAC